VGETASAPRAHRGILSDRGVWKGGECEIESAVMVWMVWISMGSVRGGGLGFSVLLDFVGGFVGGGGGVGVKVGVDGGCGWRVWMEGEWGILGVKEKMDWEVE